MLDFQKLTFVNRDADKQPARCRYTDNCPPRKIAPPVRVGVWIKVRVSFRVGGQPDYCHRGRLPLG